MSAVQRMTNATLEFLGEPAQRSAARLELNDVQGLWGGRRITLSAGRAVVQLVQTGMQETRFEFAPGDGEFERLLDQFIENDFLSIQPLERPGIPDEARPTLIFWNAAGEKKAVSKWAGVKDERFDALYQSMLQYETLTHNLEPTYRGPYSY